MALVIVFDGVNGFVNQDLDAAGLALDAGFADAEYIALALP